MKDFIKCSDCNKSIPKKRVLFAEFEDIICGECVKKAYGNNSYDFWKNEIDNSRPERLSEKTSKDDAIV